MGESPVPDGNPIIRDVSTSDPAVLVHHGVPYLDTGHDEAPEDAARYVMRDWLCFSSTDLRNLDTARSAAARRGLRVGP